MSTATLATLVIMAAVLALVALVAHLCDRLSEGRAIFERSVSRCAWGGLLCH